MSQSVSNEAMTVQFAPCGHVSSVSLAEYFQMDGGQDQLDRIEAGTQLDAAILHSSNCLECNTPVSSEIADLYAFDEQFRREEDATAPHGRCDSERGGCGKPLNHDEELVCKTWPGCFLP